MKYILCIMMLFIVAGCEGSGHEERKAAEAVKEKEEAARPTRLKVVSQNINIGRNSSAVIVQDTKTGQEFIVGAIAIASV